MSEQNGQTIQRENLLARVIDDFTYKGDPSPNQVRLWKLVRTDFDDLRDKIKEVFLLVDESAIISDSCSESYLFDNYITTLREAERWCNTAVANDYKGEEVKGGVDGVLYPVDLPDDASQRQMCCYQASEACFNLAVTLVQYIPLGRALSTALTKLQDSRGWILDNINDAME